MPKTLTLKILTLAGLAVTSVASAQNFFENWDSYANGTNMHGVNGWKGWDNDPQFTAFTSNAQAASAPNSIAITGASDLVHEYTNTLGQWVYKCKLFIPTGSTGTTYFILLNNYNDGATAIKRWSVEYNINMTTGMITDDFAPTAPPIPIVYGSWQPIRCEIDLTGNTVVQSYAGVSWPSRWWKNPADTNTLDKIAAVDLYANNVGPVYYDDIVLLPNPYLVTATSVVTTMGSTLGGNAASLSADDENKYAVLCDEFDSNGEVVATYTTLDREPKSINCVLQSRAGRNDLSQFWRIRRYSDSSWELLQFATTSLVDTNYSKSITSNVTNYSDSAGTMSMQVSWIPQGDIDAADGWSMSIDVLRFDLVP